MSASGRRRGDQHQHPDSHSVTAAGRFNTDHRFGPLLNLRISRTESAAGNPVQFLWAMSAAQSCAKAVMLSFDQRRWARGANSWRLQEAAKMR
jgi:hypothetical protein